MLTKSSSRIVVINLHLSRSLPTSWYFSLYFLLIPWSRFVLLLEFLILFLAKNALPDKNARCYCNEGRTSRGSCFRWWNFLFFINCRQIFCSRVQWIYGSSPCDNRYSRLRMMGRIFSLLQLSNSQNFSAFFQRVICKKHNRFVIFSCTIMKDAYHSIGRSSS